MVTRSEFDLLFSQICGKYGFDLDLSEDMLAKFYIISENLLSENEKFNLTAIRTLDGVILKHICDSACVANHIPAFPEGSKLLDVGSGAGFPALPLAVMRPDLSITALDATEKKVRCIEQTAKLAKIDNITCVSGRAEELAVPKSDMREAFDFVIARSVAELRMLNELCLPFLKVGGKFYAMKASRALHEATDSRNGRMTLGAAEKLDIVRLYTDEFGEDRLLMIATKKLQTSGKYPRRFANIKKSPL